MRSLPSTARDGSRVTHDLSQNAKRVAIIGGGPGGLMTALKLRAEYGGELDITLYEASGRLGGKILSESFASAPIVYEAGAAELYDYSGVGEDPLRELVAQLGLKTAPMSGRSFLVDGHVFHTLKDICRVYGEHTYQALIDFDAYARSQISPEDYYDSDWEEPAANLVERTFQDDLLAIPDRDARRIVATLVHSDLATEPHRTSSEYGLQNYLMNHPEYMKLYTIQGGIEQLPKKLAQKISCNIRLFEPVSAVETLWDGTVKVSSSRAASTVNETFDFVVVALPQNYLSSITWRDEVLNAAMHRHIVQHEYPAHYLRISLLFTEPFWQTDLGESYYILDTFGGCCLYDESSRSDCGSYGVLGWLLAGDQAVNHANLNDSSLIAQVLDKLPSFLSHGREHFLEGRVHRWIGSVNGLPAGFPPLPLERRHRPCEQHPNLLTVGDYLFDSTLNGVLDSATYVAESIAEDLHALTPREMANRA